MQATAQTPMTTRWQEITTIWKDNRWLYVIAGLLLGILVTPALEQITGNLNELIGNLVPEAVGIVFTVLILDRLASNRTKEELKKRLVREAGGQSNETAKAAIDWMRAEGWLIDDNGRQLLTGASLVQANLSGASLVQANLSGAELGFANLKGASFDEANLSGASLFQANLSGAELRQANFEGASLWDANLEGANLYDANLKGANLEHANLSGAYLTLVNLSGANLRDANLEGAIFGYANLEGAIFGYANLEGANLYDANLSGADLKDATFDEKTVLPDAELGDNKYWTPDTDMSRYTDPKHPDFWQPNWVKEQSE